MDVPDELAGMAYHVISNGTLWFLQHDLFERARRPVLDARWHAAWDGYRDYNRLFAARIAEVAAPGGTVLVHDYHLMLVGSELARTRPDLRTLHFTHTPFCEPDDLALLPDAAARELMTSMVSFGTCGFHSTRWAAAFGRCAAAVTGREPATLVSPLSPDAARLGAATASAGFAERRAALEDRLAGGASFSAATGSSSRRTSGVVSSPSTSCWRVGPSGGGGSCSWRSPTRRVPTWRSTSPTGRRWSTSSGSSTSAGPRRATSPSCSMSPTTT